MRIESIYFYPIPAIYRFKYGWAYSQPYKVWQRCWKLYSVNLSEL